MINIEKEFSLLHNKNCKNCNKEFQSKRIDAIYCGDRCRKHFDKFKKKEFLRIEQEEIDKKVQAFHLLEQEKYLKHERKKQRYVMLTEYKKQINDLKLQKQNSILYERAKIGMDKLFKLWKDSKEFESFTNRTAQENSLIGQLAKIMKENLVKKKY